jgi:long-chain acyl-CoA synthetase
MTLDPRYQSLVDVFERTVKAHGSRDLFLEKKGGRWVSTTYDDFARSVGFMRAGLLSLGVRRGDRVAIVANNCVKWAVLAHACYGIGAALVPMYEAQDPAEWRFIVRDSGAAVLVVANCEVLKRANLANAAVPSIRHIVMLDESVECAGRPVTSFRSLVAGEGAVPAPFVSPGETATILYTSGTTGTPKGVVLSHANVASNVGALHGDLRVLATDRTLSFLPWAHALGQTGELHGVFSFGASIAICEGVERLLGNLIETRPTILVSVPRVFNRLYAKIEQGLSGKPPFVRAMVRRAVGLKRAQREGRRLRLDERAVVGMVDRAVFSKIRATLGGRLRWAVVGGAALSPDVAEFVDALGIAVYEGYGLTETSPVISVNTESARKIGSVGRPLPGVRVEVCDDGVGVPTEDGEGLRRDGEIVVYGPNVMQGYYGRPQETAAAFTPDGGLRTGDLGYVDEEGFVHVTGRIKEQYKLENGKYVVPTPIEERLKLSPFVTNVMVYGANRPHNVALVVADVGAVRGWAAERRLSVPFEVPLLLQDERIRALFKREIDARQVAVRAFERVRDFELLGCDFTIENGMLTPSQKLKRRKVLEVYGEVFDRLYGSRAGAGAGALRSVLPT